ncbi:DNA-directed RNA polymerase subunit alpha [Desulfurispira natronophila]|uniref:DNA-directed RNA polymerase subunit alpha n=1 Tax=Desulfurispira natronophila TaxID=682562 RepID=A0A7W7Y5F4_9BACT|nr:DNA-directed RNA polymerase subunit alpha [Desulfurispira natronophila]MBB5022431.1 DNA-directed RNA polymerase subunit alpha [Desulfurispira natronophila]
MMMNWNEIIRPRALVCDTKTATDTYSKFIAEPLERGFGITLGNSLRRVLLSSLEGAAVTSIRIEHVLHEFSTVPGVVEDVTDIILNVKQLRFKMLSPGEKQLTLKSNKVGSVTAGALECPPDVQVLTPDAVIATLGREDAELNMELRVDIGRAYRLAEDNKTPDDTIDVIPVDSLFNPVVKVNYHVEQARVGQDTNFDKLILEVWTDGSVSPEDAVAFAAKIIKDQLAIFINFEDVEEPVVVESEDDNAEELFSLLGKSVEELELSVRSYNCLNNIDIRTIADLVCRSENELLKTKNFGKKSLLEIKEILKEMNLTLGMDLEAMGYSFEAEGSMESRDDAVEAAEETEESTRG